MAKMYLGDEFVGPALDNSTIFGASIESFAGKVEADGTLTKNTPDFTLNYAGVKKLGNYSLEYAFYNNKSLVGINFPDLEIIDNGACYAAFQLCNYITNIAMPKVSTVSDNGLQFAFDGTSITNINFQSLTTVNGVGMYGTFRDCTSLTSILLPLVETVGDQGMAAMLSGCTALTTISFPALTSVQTNSLGNGAGDYIFANDEALTEIHFRADAQAAIEATIGYADKWGATNATIFFDL